MGLLMEQLHLSLLLVLRLMLSSLLLLLLRPETTGDVRLEADPAQGPPTVVSNDYGSLRQLHVELLWEESKQVGLAKTILLLRQCLHTCRGRSGNYIPDFTWKRVARDACAAGLVPDDCEWQNIRDRYLQASEDVRQAA